MVKKASSSLEHIAKSRGRVTVPDLLRANQVSKILETVNGLTDIRNIVVVTFENRGPVVWSTFGIRNLITILEATKHSMVDRMLYLDDYDETDNEEEADNGAAV